MEIETLPQGNEISEEIGTIAEETETTPKDPLAQSEEESAEPEGEAAPEEAPKADFSALAERVVGTLLSIVAENEGRTLLLGTHATPVRMIEAYARGLSVSEAHSVPWAPNASLSAYLCEGSTVTPLFYGFDAYEGEKATTVARDM